MSTAKPFFAGINPMRLEAKPQGGQFEDISIMDEDNKQSNKRKRDTDDDGDDSEDEGEAPYDEKQEAFPTHPAFDPRIAELKASATAHLRRLSTELSKYEQCSESLKHLRVKAEKAAEMREPDRQWIALVGDAGAGKSSVLNAVTDIPGLARVVAGGESCTTVPTLYIDSLSHQSEGVPFAAGIRYLTPEDSTLLMQELLDSYNLKTFEPDETWSLEQASEYSQSSETAMRTFRCLFCRQPEFATESAAELTLGNDYHAKGQGLLTKMTDWCKELLRDPVDGGTGESYKSAEFYDVKALGEWVEEHTLPFEDYDAPSLWPLVENVSIGARNSRLLEKVTIADLAGLTDTHKVRVKATHRYISQSDAMWYVAGVERVVTDPNLEKTLTMYAERFPGTLAIVVTKIDRGLDDALAKDMKKKKMDVRRYDILSSELKDLGGNIKKDQTRLKRLKTSGSEDYFALAQKVEDSESKAQLAALERTAVLVKARGEFITRRLKEDKQKYLPEGIELPVHCVSNSQYFAHKQVDDADDIIMDPATTGIPDLRAYALGLAAPAIWEETKAYLLFSVAGFLRGASAWAEADHNQRRTGLMQCVNTAQKKWNMLMDPAMTLRLVQELLINDLIKKMHDGQQKSLDGALAALQTVEGWNPSSFLAFFRKHGKHSTKTVGSLCWHQMFTRTQKDLFLLPAWERVLPQLQDMVRSAIKEISKAIQDLPERLERNPGSAPLAVGTFQDMLQPHVVGINAALQRRSRAYEHSLSNVKLDATLDQPSAFFTKAMDSVYENNKRNGGQGSAARWKHALREHLTLAGNKSPFAIAANELESTLKAVAKTYVTDIRDDIQSILDEISSQMSAIMDCSNETDEEAAARKALLPILQDIMPEIRDIEARVKKLDGKR